jgi:hypothetical protein
MRRISRISFTRKPTHLPRTGDTNDTPTSPLAPLLDRLFDEAEAARRATQPRRRSHRRTTGRDDAEQDRVPRPLRTLKDVPLAVSRETGALLYMLARSCARERSSSSAPRSASRPCTSPQACATMAAAA